MQEAGMVHSRLLRTANEQLAVTYGLKCPRPDPLCMCLLPGDLEGDGKIKPLESISIQSNFDVLGVPLNYTFHNHTDK